jgi:hypothetical protein
MYQPINIFKKGYQHKFKAIRKKRRIDSQQITIEDVQKAIRNL